MVFAQVMPNLLERKHADVREYQEAMKLAGLESERLSYGSLEGYPTAKTLVMALRATARPVAHCLYPDAGKPARRSGGDDRAIPAGGAHGAPVDLAIVGRDGRFAHRAPPTPLSNNAPGGVVSDDAAGREKRRRA